MIDNSDMIFVFGSNEIGLHGAGGSLYAYENCGAILGYPYGAQGKSFAIPTMDENGESLNIEDIQKYVDGFIKYALERGLDNKENYETYKIIRIGTGICGYSDEQMASLFINAPPNCYFDEKWREFLPEKKFWGTY